MKIVTLAYNRKKVRLRRKYTVVFAVFIILFFTASRVDNKMTVDKFYLQQLELLNRKITSLKKNCSQKASLKILQDQFKQTRLVYKRIAVLTEYFNIYESKYVNGAAINRVEDDNPDKIIPPTGFQQIEQLLFNPWLKENYRLIAEQTDILSRMITRLKNEPDGALKFRNDLVFNALTSSVIRLITTGITGFDSPLAFNSLPEANATLDGIQKIVAIYRNDIQNKNSAAFIKLNSLITSAKKFLLINTNFNSFDRLKFITDYANPLYSFLQEARQLLNIPFADGLQPVSVTAKNIFDKNAFDLKYFTPDKNYLPTAERIELGRQLFYDTILSQAKGRSCASCHKPQLAFTDGLKTALSVDNKTSLVRNTPTLLNSVFQTRQFYDSREDILENQLNEVVHNSDEMKGSLKQSVTDLKNSQHYYSLFQQAYIGEKEPVSAFNIANAVSSYVRSLTSMNSRFDQYMRGDEKKLTAGEKNGFNLFMGKAKCATCHFIPLFNGLVPPVFTESESEVLGVPKTKDKSSPELDPDPGKYNFTQSVIHKYAFKTPTLRNIELTAPYMHNGVYNTLEEVMEFYNNGGGKGLKIAPENQTLPFDKLNLSKKEIADVIRFMKSLTDTAHVNHFTR